MATTLAHIQQRRKTAAAWTSSNEVLLASEIGVETDTGKWKLGDGSTAWNSLAYQPSNASVAAAIATQASTDAATYSGVTVGGVFQSAVTIDTTPLVASDVGAYTTAQTDSAIATAISGISYPALTTPLQLVPVGYYAMPACTNTANLALAVNTPVATPLFVDKSMTFDSLGINVTVAATTGGVVRVAVFGSDTNGYPLSSGGIVVQTGALASTATGIVSEAHTFTLTRGIYWVAAVAQTATCSVEGCTGVIPSPPQSSGTAVNGLTAGSVTSTFFSGYGPTGGTGTGPRVRLHRSA